MKPLLGILCNLRHHETGHGHVVNTSYIDAVERYMHVTPILIPCLTKTQTQADLKDIIAHIDGLLLTGSRTNIHPSLFGMAEDERFPPFDPARDRTALALIDMAQEKNLPLLGICRGMQEMAVALGMCLNPDIHKRDGNLDHPMPQNVNFDTAHAARHNVTFPQNGFFHHLLHTTHTTINSLHRQAIDTPNDKITIEATADDGVIEAISIREQNFAIGVQWHPEFQTGENIISAPLFAGFEQAMRDYACNRLKAHPK